MTLIIESPSMMMSIQDEGRSGYQRYGLPESGPMDWWAFRAANDLVGNDGGTCACLEIGFTDAVLVAEADALMAFTGAGYRLSVNRRQVPLWMAFRVRVGDILQLDKVPGGNWSYLAVSGGFLSHGWMGSRSVYPRAGLGRMLISGDYLPFSAGAGDAHWLAGRTVPESARAPYSLQPILRVVLGPHQAYFSAKEIQTFLDTDYRLSSQSDRMGYRLTGAPLHHGNRVSLVSRGMALGEIQVPADGQPIVMMPDHPTTGGYPCIGTIARVDLPLLAQVQPEEALIRFQSVEVDQARETLKDIVRRLDASIQTQEEQWLGL